MPLHCPKHPIPLLWQKVVLRVLLASSTICFVNTLILSIREGLDLFPLLTLWMPLLFVFFHHTVRLWQKWWWWVIGEMAYSLIELGGVIYINVNTHTSLTPFLGQANGSVAFMLAVSWLAISACTFTAFLFLLWDTFHYHGKNLRQPYTFVGGSYHNAPDSQWRLMFGNFTMRKRFRSDTRITRYTRGGFAILCLLSLSYLGVFSLLGQPLQQSGQVVVKTLRVPRVELAQGPVPHDPWNPWGPWQLELDIGMDTPSMLKAIPRPTPNLSGIFSAFNASTKLRRFYPYNCSKTARAIPSSVLVICLPIVQPSMFHDLNLEILFTIDFSAIHDNFQRQLEVGVYPAATNSSEDIRANTKPILLGPGSHLAGYSWFSFKDQISNRGVTVLGIQQYNRIVVSQVDSLSPDWSIQKDNNIATLRLRIKPQDEVLIEREYYENSVISGFALLGGVWTAMNGIFAAIFGSTLLLVLFGIKPLSIYGLVHLFHARWGSLVSQDCTLPAEERDRVLATLKEHLLDVDEDWQNTGTYRTPVALHRDKRHSRTQDFVAEEKWANLV